MAEKELFLKRPRQAFEDDSPQRLNAAVTLSSVKDVDTELVMTLSQKIMQENAECYAALSE